MDPEFSERFGPHYYDRAGQPISLWRWVELFEDFDYRLIRLTELHEHDARIGTVWLGLDHAFLYPPPLIFETMISTLTVRPHVFFGRVELSPDWDDFQWRYSTEEQAISGHEQAVAKYLHERASR